MTMPHSLLGGQSGAGLTPHAMASARDVEQAASKALRKRALLCCFLERTISRNDLCPAGKAVPRRSGWGHAQKQTGYPQPSCPGPQQPWVRRKPCDHEVFSGLYQSSSSVMHSFVVFRGLPKSHFPKHRKLPLLNVLPRNLQASFSILISVPEEIPILSPVLEHHLSPSWSFALSIHPIKTYLFIT